MHFLENIFVFYCSEIVVSLGGGKMGLFPPYFLLLQDNERKLD